MARQTFLGILEYQTMDYEPYCIRFFGARMLPPFPFSGGSAETWERVHLYYGTGGINLVLLGLNKRVEYLVVKPVVTKPVILSNEEDPIENWD